MASSADTGYSAGSRCSSDETEGKEREPPKKLFFFTLFFRDCCCIPFFHPSRVNHERGHFCFCHVNLPNVVVVCFPRSRRKRGNVFIYLSRCERTGGNGSWMGKDGWEICPPCMHATYVRTTASTGLFSLTCIYNNSPPPPSYRPTYPFNFPFSPASIPLVRPSRSQIYVSTARRGRLSIALRAARQLLGVCCVRAAGVLVSTSVQLSFREGWADGLVMVGSCCRFGVERRIFPFVHAGVCSEDSFGAGGGFVLF